jgi:hypothetical protein
MPLPFGSASSQSSYRLPGKIGHTSPQPMVITTSDACTASVVISWGTPWLMSMPSSRIASIATGLISVPGSEPPERTLTAPPERALRYPAAICERPALWMQTKRTVGLTVMSGFLG